MNLSYNTVHSFHFQTCVCCKFIFSSLHDSGSYQPFIDLIHGWRTSTLSVALFLYLANICMLLITFSHNTFKKSCFKANLKWYLVCQSYIYVFLNSLEVEKIL